MCRRALRPQRKVGPMISELPVAYFAGHFDGEGCIHGRSQVGKKSHVLTVQVCGYYEETVRDYCAKWGGSVSCRAKGSSNGSSVSRCDVYRWVAAGKNAISFLKDVLPYLREKRVQAELAVTWPQSKSGVHLSPEDRKIRADMVKRLKELKL
jgi:hypothetical protein